MGRTNGASSNLADRLHYRHSQPHLHRRDASLGHDSDAQLAEVGTEVGAEVGEVDIQLGGCPAPGGKMAAVAQGRGARDGENRRKMPSRAAGEGDDGESRYFPSLISGFWR